MPTLSAPASNAFASALRRAVEDSGLGLENIQRRLAQRDVRVSVATLSYWQNGNRVPGRKHSEMVVAHLESVLDLEPHSLRRLVPPPRPRGRVVTPPVDGMSPSMAAHEAVRRIAELVQKRNHGHLLTRISQQDWITVGADRRIESLRTRTIARADADDVRGLGLTHYFEDPTAGTPQVTIHSGAITVDQHVSERHRVLGTELRFSRPLGRGDTVVLDVEVTAAGAGPRDTSYDASCNRSIREYVVLARFPLDDRPVRCEQFHSTFGEPGETRRQVAVDELGHAHAVHLDCEPGTTGLQWFYA